MGKKKWLSIKPKNFGSDVTVTRPSVRTSVRLHHTITTLEITLSCAVSRFFSAKSHGDPRFSKDNNSQKQFYNIQQKNCSDSFKRKKKN